MIVNGRPTLACRTLTKNVGPDITLAPLPFFELIGDLSSTRQVMRALSERSRRGATCSSRSRPDPARGPHGAGVADAIFELDRCIECGCCLAGCGTARMRKDSWVQSASTRSPASASTARRADRRGLLRSDRDDDGVFGCMSLLGCHDVCPKELPLQTQIAFIRRKDGQGRHVVAQRPRACDHREGKSQWHASRRTF